MKTSLHKIVSLVLCVILVFAFTCSVFADGNPNNTEPLQITSEYVIDQLNKIDADTFNKYPGYKEAIDKVKAMLKEGYTLEQVRSTFTKSDLEIIKGIGLYEKSQIRDIQTPQVQNQADIFAKQYYDYYKKHGELPYVEKSNPLYSPAVVYDPVLSGMGYYFTSEEVGSLLARLGIAAGLDGPFPYMDMICIIAGAVILTESAYVYYLYGDAINAEVSSFFGSTVDTYAEDSYASTADYAWYRYWTNTKYWSALRVNYRGLGGVAILGPITSAGAIARLAEGMDTYAYFDGEACSVAALATGNNPARNNAHTSNGQILNLPHWHPTISGQQTGAHSFFTY